MKTLKYIALGFLAIAGFTLQSCSDSDDYDVKGDPRTFIYIDHNAADEVYFNVAHTPLGNFGTDIYAEFPIKIQYLQSSPTEVKLVVDNSLIEDFCTKNATELQTLGVEVSELPAEVLAVLQLSKTIIPAGSYEGEGPLTVSLPNEYWSLLTEPYYVVPLRVESFVKKDVRGSEDYGVAYLIISTTDKIAKFVEHNAANAIVHTPAGVITSDVNGNFNVSLNYALTEDIDVTAVPNNDLVSLYNMNNGANAQAFPDEFVSQFVITPAVVPAESTASAGSIDVFLPSSVAETLPVGSYVLPLNLKYTYSTGDVVVDEDEVAYVVLDVIEDSRMVKPNGDASDMLGTEVSSYSGWSSDPANLFRSNGSVNTNYSLGSSSPATFTVTMPQEYNVTGIRIIPMYGSWGYTATLLQLEVSTDGSSWMDCGTLEGDELTWQSGGRYYYPLYGAVPAKYLRVTVTVETAAYGSYYNRLQGFAVYTE